ncbi:HotDog domain-containing protein [Phaeosphaeriaceae sp. PMI808]|nr:HotDog domain-containing protein [Phaeosphaeriaceae sp. PMI808]
MSAARMTLSRHVGLKMRCSMLRGELGRRGIKDGSTRLGYMHIGRNRLIVNSTRLFESALFAHPLTQSLLNDPSFTASRPHLKIPEALRPQTLTGGTLLGADKIVVPPVQFSTEDGSRFVSLQYLGSALCGHPGIGLARCCFPALPNKVAVTASLKIEYKAPVMAGQVVVLRAETTKVEGRKAWVKGWLETLVDEASGEKPVILTEGEALFIEPRQAASMRRVVGS